MGDEPVVPGDGDDGGSASIRVFMSYRRADDRHFIGRLHDRLCDAFGDEMVFRDIDSIPAGTNFRSVILRTLDEVDAVVAVIGPRWARAAGDEDGADYVYLELAEALKQATPVIPVLMEDTSMPDADSLPPDLRPLTEINAMVVHGDPAFRRDSGRLVEAVREVVAADRARIAEERRAAEERSRAAEAERSERERLAEQLRAEERAARLRLAELEEANARRQIELERARLEAIAEQLRLAGVADSAPPVGAAQASGGSVGPTAAPAQPPAAPVQPPAAAVQPPAAPVQPPAAEVPPSAGARTTGRVGIEQVRLQALIVAALVLGVVALFIDRTDHYFGSQFNELSSDWRVDTAAWILALAVAVPLFLGTRQVEQWHVLVAVSVSSLCFGFLQSSASLRYGSAKYDEGSWGSVKLLQAACLAAAIWVSRHHATSSARPHPRGRRAITATAVVCGALLIAAIRTQWTDAEALVGSVVYERTAFGNWLLVVLVPIAATVGLALRRSYGARIALATLATLAVVSHVSESLVLDELFQIDGSPWVWNAAAYGVLAAAAWWTAIAVVRRADRGR